MKYCSKGEHTVDESKFRRSSRNKDGLQAWCRPCFAQYEKDRYHSGDKARKDRNKQLILKKSQDYIWSLLAKSSCKNCGISNPLVLEFDHRDPTEKSGEISEIMKHNLENLKKEIAKCDILCANCHRIRTNYQFSLWRTVRVLQETQLGVG